MTQTKVINVHRFFKKREALIKCVVVPIRMSSLFTLVDITLSPFKCNCSRSHCLPTSIQGVIKL